MNDFSNFSILITDSDKDSRDTLAEYVSQFKVELHLASNSKEATLLLEQHHIDLITLAANLDHDGEGTELLKKINEDYHHQTIR